MTTPSLVLDFGSEIFPFMRKEVGGRKSKKEKQEWAKMTAGSKSPYRLPDNHCTVVLSIQSAKTECQDYFARDL